MTAEDLEACRRRDEEDLRQGRIMDLRDVQCLDDRHALLGEVGRLREALKTIQGWDMLNPPPQDGSDFPWLKRLVDDALSGGGAATMTPGGIAEDVER